MGELTLESLAARVAELEKKLAEVTQPKDWRQAIGSRVPNEFSARVDEEVRLARERERLAARRGEEEPFKDWRLAAGTMQETEFSRAMDEEVRRAKEAAREAARRGDDQ